MTVKVTKAEINQRELATRVELQDRYIGTDELSAKKVDVLNQFELPAGTTAQRPDIPGAGSTRWNTETQALEVYNGTNWIELTSDYVPTGSTVFG
jgi:hypothetical protein